VPSPPAALLDDPVNAKTLREVTTKYDGRGRPVARTTWLVARGMVDAADPPIAGLGGVSTSDGLTEQFLYDDDLTDGVGLDSSGGAALLIGSNTVSLTAAIAKLADTDAKSETTTYAFDARGRQVSQTDRLGALTAFAYSPTGSLLGLTDAESQITSYTYDDAGRIVTAISGRYVNTVTYGYDDGGRKSTEAMTIGGQTYTTTTAYDVAGQVSGYTYPDGTAVGRTYTDRGQLATIAYASTTVDTRTYDDGGRMTGSSYNNGVNETRAYGWMVPPTNYCPMASAT